MKTISAGLQTRLDSGLFTLNVLFRIERTDATIFAFTDADVSIEYDGDTYLPGITDGRDSQRLGLAPSSQQFDAIIDSAYLPQADVDDGLFDYAALKVFAIDRNAVADGPIKGLRGNLGKVERGDVMAQVEVRSLLDRLRQTVSQLFLLKCPHDLGDARCTVNLVPFTVTGSVTGVADNQNFTTSLGGAAGLYDAGLLTWTAGNNNGRARHVKRYTLPVANGVFELAFAMEREVQIGDTFSVSQGCLKTTEDCIARYSNIVNYGGFPFIPGQTKMLKQGGQ